MDNIGALNKRIEIGTISDGFNEETGRDDGDKAFQTQRELWAGVKHVKGSEYFAAAAENKQNTLTFRIRYQPDFEITQDHYVRYKGKVYDIKEANDVDEGHDAVILTCEEVR